VKGAGCRVSNIDATKLVMSLACHTSSWIQHFHVTLARGEEAKEGRAADGRASPPARSVAVDGDRSMGTLDAGRNHSLVTVGGVTAELENVDDGVLQESGDGIEGKAEDDVDTIRPRGADSGGSAGSVDEAGAEAQDMEAEEGKNSEERLADFATTGRGEAAAGEVRACDTVPSFKAAAESVRGFHGELEHAGDSVERQLPRADQRADAAAESVQSSGLIQRSSDHLIVRHGGHGSASELFGVVGDAEEPVGRGGP
jgi:hypothetical protein